MAEKKKGFGYTKLPYRYVTLYKEGAWDAGCLSENENVVINESASVLQYAQTCFEGMKAYKTKSGKAVIFRPDLNAERMEQTCIRLKMPVIPQYKFIDAVKQVVKANVDYIPSYEEGGSLYIRPFMIGTSPVIPILPATEYQFRIYCSPVGYYFGGGVNALKLQVSDYDRAAPHGTGNIKAGLNYAMSLYVTMEAHEKGFDENVYLDPATRTFIEETGGANLLFVSKEGHLIVPKSDSILPSITRRSLVYIAQNYFNIEVEERQVRLEELADFVECGMCGTAAVLSPVKMISDHGKEYDFTVEEDGYGKILGQLRKTLVGIQVGDIEAPEGWVVDID